jgi:glycosyltransferase involved in cell wall biosynthesis
MLESRVLVAPRLSIVMPAFNEGENLPEVIPQVSAACRAVCGNAFELLVVDDGSTDGTARVLSNLGETIPQLRSVVHPLNRGLTAALRTGFSAAQGELVLFVPADGQLPPSEIARFFEVAEPHDLILSTYRHREAGAFRHIQSRVLRLLLRLTLGLRDRLEGPYLFRRSLLDEMTLVATRSAGSIGFEIAAKARAAGHRIHSIEIDYAPRLRGSSKVGGLRDVLDYLEEMKRIRRSMQR